MQNILRRLALTTAGWLAVGVSAQAAEIEIRAMQFYCPDTVTELRDKLSKVEGVEGVEIDRNEGSTKFKAATPAAVKSSLEAVVLIGLHGKPMVDGKPTALPSTRAPAGTKAVKAVFRQVHLGCRAGSNGIVKALEKHDEVATIDCDQKSNTVVVTARGGSELDVPALQDSLNASGYNALWDSAALAPKKK